LFAVALCLPQGLQMYYSSLMDAFISIWLQMPAFFEQHLSVIHGITYNSVSVCVTCVSSDITIFSVFLIYRCGKKCCHIASTIYGAGITLCLCWEVPGLNCDFCGFPDTSEPTPSKSLDIIQIILPYRYM
jgi:hypothetical protein